VRDAGRGRAGGKVILLGEHAVVYGRPALAAALRPGVEVEVVRGRGPLVETDRRELAGDARPGQLVGDAASCLGLDPREWVARIHAELPAGRGLGSSAALVIAVLRALADAAGTTLSTDDERALGRRLEAIFHGTPSGIDPTAAAEPAGRCFRFVRGEPPTVTPLRPRTPLPLVIAFGARPRSTGAAVGGLRERWEADRASYERLFDGVAAAVEAGARAAEAGDVAALGRAFDENQALLEELGVSAPEVETLIDVARRGGALGAKLTGGGAGGAVIALTRDPERLGAILRETGAETLVVHVGAEVERAA
jgi:mevalonate kinase